MKNESETVFYSLHEWLFFVAYFDTNLFHYARVCMLIVAFDNKIAVERAKQPKTLKAFFRVKNSKIIGFKMSVWYMCQQQVEIIIYNVHLYVSAFTLQKSKLGDNLLFSKVPKSI